MTAREVLVTLVAESQKDWIPVPYDQALELLEQDLVGLLPEKKKGFYTCYNPNHGVIMSVSEVEDRNFNTGQCSCGWDVKCELPLINEGYNRALTEVENAIRNYVRGE